MNSDYTKKKNVGKIFVYSLQACTKYSTNILAGKKYLKNYLCLVLKIIPGYHHSPVKCEHDPDALVAGLDPVHRVSVADHHSPVNMIRMPWLLALLPSTGSV